jgi:hypothetical protein
VRIEHVLERDFKIKYIPKNMKGCLVDFSGKIVEEKICVHGGVVWDRRFN